MDFKYLEMYGYDAKTFLLILRIQLLRRTGGLCMHGLYNSFLRLNFKADIGPKLQCHVHGNTCV